MHGKFFLTIFIISISLMQISKAQNSPENYVNAHNEARSEVGVKPLTWNGTIAKYAQEYVDKEVVKCNELEHSISEEYGENLAESDTNELTGVEAVKLWVEEKIYYDYGENKCVGGQCQHYTQVIWSDSSQLGCGRAKCNNGLWLVCCNYHPPGNLEGEFPY